MQTAIAVTLLTGLVLLVRRPYAKMFGAGAAYALWLLPIARIFVPNITVPRLFPEKASDVIFSLPSSEMILLKPEMIEAAAKPSLTSQALPFIISTWLIGAIAFFLYQWLRQAAFMDKLLYNSESAQGLQSVIISAAKVSGLKHIPLVKIADDNSGPLVSGVLEPVVILPNDFAESFSTEQQHYALLHEFMHIKRGDLFVAIAGLAFRSLNWPNPLVHYAASHFRSDQEAACDASVLKALGGGEKILSTYAETLVHAAKAAAQKTTLKGRASPQTSPLALTIHHPLKERLMILGTHKKTSTWRTRTTAAVMIIGAAALTAPLTQATSHPDEELAGKPHAFVKNKSKSILKFTSEEDGGSVSKHYEINIDGDKVEAFEIDNAGRKTSVDPSDIEGVVMDGNELNYMTEGDFEKWHKGDFKDWVDGDFKNWIDGDFKTWIDARKDGAKVFEFAGIPKPPIPPQITGKSGHIIILDDEGVLEGLEGLQGLKGLKALKGFEGLEALKSLEALKALDGKDIQIKMRMQSAESMLEAAESLIEQAKEQGTESRKVSKAKRELEKARRSLKEVERALKDD